MKNKKAFTLAEVLITLTIIGIIAALTIPNLMKSYQSHQTYVALNKNYTVLKNAYQLVAKEYGDYPDWNHDNTDIHVRLWERFGEYLKYEKKCENETGCWTKTKSKSLSNITPNGGDFYLLYTANPLSYGYKLQDGTNIAFSYQSNGNMVQMGIKNYYNGKNRRAGVIFVDINGDKKPNQLGTDIFIFVVIPGVSDKRGIVPSGIDQEYGDYRCDRTLNKNMAGANCAYRVLKEHGIYY